MNGVDKGAFRDWESKKENDGYVRLANSFLDSDLIRSLSGNAFKVYVYMRQWAYRKRKSNGQFLTYTLSMVMNILNVSEPTANKAILELQSKKIIKRLNNSRQERRATKWCFVGEWSDEDEKHFYVPRAKNSQSQNIGYVYLVKLDKYYKVGISVTPETRLKEFTLLPYPLEEVFIVRVGNYKQVEEDLHKIFDKRRIRGEWFDLTDEDVSFIGNYLEERKIN